MLWRLERTGKHATRGVTTCALSRRAMKDTIDMTDLATYGNVRAGQWKSRDGVIKIEPTLAVGGRIGCQHERQRDKRQKHDGKPAPCAQHPSLRDPAASSHRDRLNSAVLSLHNPALSRNMTSIATVVPLILRQAQSASPTNA